MTVVITRAFEDSATEVTNTQLKRVGRAIERLEAGDTSHVIKNSSDIYQQRRLLAGDVFVNVMRDGDTFYLYKILKS